MRDPRPVLKENFEEELVAALPELEPDLRELRKWWGDEQPGLTTVVADVLGAHLRRNVDAGEVDRIQRTCVFMERMATSPDADMREALMWGLLEVLGDDRERLEKARAQMGPATIEASHEVERYWGRENDQGEFVDNPPG